MPQAKVSIIIPVYNSEKFLDRCLKSINAQTYKDIEIIMVNDGSTDNSHDVIASRAKEQSNLIALDQPNQGPAVARRTGMQQASGDYVMFLDSDDTLEEDAVEFLVQKLVECNLDAVYCGFNRIFGDRKTPSEARNVEGVLGREQMLDLLFNPQFHYIACMCFSKRELWDESMFCENREMPSEDILTNIRLVLKCNRVGLYDKRLYNYYQVPTSLTMTGRYFSQTLWHNYFSELKKDLSREGLLEKYKDAIKINEIHTFSFYINDLDTSDDWYKQVMTYDVGGYTRKIRVLHRLLHWPWLLRLCVKGNRLVKRLLGRQR